MISNDNPIHIAYIIGNSIVFYSEYHFDASYKNGKLESERSHLARRSLKQSQQITKGKYTSSLEEE